MAWRVEVSLGHKANGQRRRTRRTVATYPQAKKLRVQMLKTQQEGRLTEVRNETVKTYGLWWAREVKPKNIRRSTAADYEYRLRQYVFPFLGSMRMVDLTSRAVQQWMLDLSSKDHSANTINGARRILFGLCKHAARQGVIQFNPVGATDPVRRQGIEQTQVQNPWTSEEITKVLDNLEDSRLDCFLHLMLHTGMRPGEVLGLRWEDLDQDKTMITVRHTLKQERLITPEGKGVVRLVLNDPKTAHSHRDINISAALRNALDRQQMTQSTDRMIAGPNWKETGHVITTSAGTPFSASNLRQVYITYLKTIGVRYIRFHDIRHSFAVLALDRGALLEQLSQTLGHTRVDTTKQIYAKVVPRYTEEVISFVSDALPPARRNPRIANEPEIKPRKNGR